MTYRYLRQILVRDFGAPAQSVLKRAHIALIGLGGIGSPASLYLASAGIGAITIFEDDAVDESNLHRQILFTGTDIGKSKADAGAARLKLANPDMNITLGGHFSDQSKASFDLLLDGSDQLQTRHEASRFTRIHNIPLLSASIAQWEGQIAHFHPSQSGGCYHCLYPQDTDPTSIPSCSEAGVIGPVAGMIGSWAALEALKIITNINPLPTGQMMLIDGMFRESRILKIKKRVDCTNCA